MKKEVKVRKRKRGQRSSSRSGNQPLFKVILCVALLGATVFFIWGGIQDLQTTTQLKLSIQQNQKEISELEEEKEELEKTYNNLNNPDYARYYAMGRYHVTQNGEQVFIFPGADEKEETEE